MTINDLKFKWSRLGPGLKVDRGDVTGVLMENSF